MAVRYHARAMFAVSAKPGSSTGIRLFVAGFVVTDDREYWWIPVDLLT